jgi:glycosyltransferase involved in cell wall biosynthesis
MITVGVPEWHGMIDEQSRNPPSGYTYKSIDWHRSSYSRIFKSDIKGGFFATPGNDCDIVEAVVLPVVTDKPWVYSVAHFAEPMAFNFLGAPLPKSVRRLVLQRLFERRNFLGITYWSEAARSSADFYGEVSHAVFQERSAVVYPGVALAPDRGSPPKTPQILFSGQFFRKGGMHVVDAFGRLKREFPDAKLRICSDLSRDFVTESDDLRRTYLAKITDDPDIVVGRVTRAQLLDDILPETSVYVLPSYQEAFGFAALEAIAFGVPVVAADIFAIPEIVSDRESGILLPFTRNVDPKKIVSGYGVKEFDRDLHQEISSWVYEALREILGSFNLQVEMGRAGQVHARSKFSFRVRNERMGDIYRRGLAR